MSAEWKPGDVAMVTQRGGGIERRSFRRGTSWVADIGEIRDPYVENIRPLVVIDPEDREQVERLAREYHESDHIAPWPELHQETRDAISGALQAALRSLVTPPKPDEPTGLGAVVEAAHDNHYVRVGNGPAAWWRVGDPPSRGTYEWRVLDVVRVLSDGVTP